MVWEDMEHPLHVRSPSPASDPHRLVLQIDICEEACACVQGTHPIIEFHFTERLRGFDLFVVLLTPSYPHHDQHTWMAGKHVNTKNNDQQCTEVDFHEMSTYVTNS